MAADPGPLAQDYAVVWHNSKREYYVDGCGLERIGSDEWVAVVPVVPRLDCFEPQRLGERRAKDSRVHIVHSGDGGTSWQPVAELPYFSAAPWQHDGLLYLFAFKGGVEYRNDDLQLLQSGDGGRSWSDPVTLFEGHFWNAHTGMAKRDNRIYWSFDDLSFDIFRGPRVVVGDLGRDLMDPRSWRLSKPVPFPGIPEQLIQQKFSAHPSHYLEPNVIDVYGQLRVLATVKPKRQTTTGLCAVLDVTDDGDAVELSFAQYHPMPGGQLKFDVRWDDVSRMFWAAVNLAADGQGVLGWESEEGSTFRGRPFLGGNDRRFLMLMYGLDGLNWFQAGCVARAGKLSQSFMYPALAIDGNDLVIVSRSSVHAPNRHDADYATFHRVGNFRDLAMNLHPDAG
jgi:hypothetical protein